jgi:rSAM/selenodomain-associated transferase 1
VTRAVIVMTKAPVPGVAKTRLCPPCNHHQAAVIAEASLVQTLDAVAAARVERRVVALAGGPLRLPPGFEMLKQRGVGLAERLAHAFDRVGGPAVLIGMDTPQITPEAIELALDALDHADAAIGPTYDGGYWAISLRSPDRRVFTGVLMSTTSTFRHQMERLHALGMTCRRLPRLRDVDFFTDAVTVAAGMPGSGFASAVESVRTSLRDVS